MGSASSEALRPAGHSSKWTDDDAVHNFRDADNATSGIAMDSSSAGSRADQAPVDPVEVDSTPVGAKPCGEGGPSAKLRQDKYSPAWDDDDDSSDGSKCRSKPEEEQVHFSKVCLALQRYSLDCMPELCRIEAHMHSLSADDLVLLGTPISQRVDSIRTGVQLNQEFLNLLLESSSSDTEGGSCGESTSDSPRGGELRHAADDTNPHKDAATAAQATGQHAGRNRAAAPATGASGTAHGCGKHGRSAQTDARPGAALTAGTVAPAVSAADSECRAAGGASCAESTAAVTTGVGHDAQQSSAEHKEVAPPPSAHALMKHHRNAPHQHGSQCTSQSDISKVRGTLRQFARDWSDEGQDERNASYSPLLADLEHHLPAGQFRATTKRFARVLCPGSGLGRLPYEVVRRGYSCHGNEFSYFMLLGSNFILNNAAPRHTYKLQPYCLSTSNRWGSLDHLLVISIPDVCVPEALGQLHADQEFAMCAGEFVEVYGGHYQCWDAVLTCFFIDTAKNVFLYIRTIADILRPGGLWSNIGPLLFHYAEVSNEISIELSWEEIRIVILEYFTFEVEERSSATYTATPKSMMRCVYDCVHFRAIRNTVPVHGKSNPVYDD